MAPQLLRFADHAPGRPYHAALVVQRGRTHASELHGHADFFEFMGLVRGHGRHLLPGDAQELAAGDVVLARPRDRHALQGLSQGGMHFVNIAFPAPLWRGFVDLTGLAPAAAWNRAARPPHWRLTAGAAERSEGIFRRALERYHHRPTMLDALRFWTDLAELVTELPCVPTESAASPAASRAPSPEPAAAPTWLAAVCTAMRGEENLRAGVARMLALAAVSPAHLSRSMRAHHGTTPTAFVAGLRLQRAAELLTATSEPITAIAHRCGFASQSYFTRCFGAAHGVPPREYRRRVRQAFVP